MCPPISQVSMPSPTSSASLNVSPTQTCSNIIIIIIINHSGIHSFFKSSCACPHSSSIFKPQCIMMHDEFARQNLPREFGEEREVNDFTVRRSAIKKSCKSFCRSLSVCSVDFRLSSPPLDAYPCVTYIPCRLLG